MSVNQEVLGLLNENLSKNPSLFELNLQFMQISDLLPYMQLLGHFKNLKKLSLHGNRIKQLPIDMSKLAGLQELDLSNNLIKDINLAIISLQTLPSLKRLNFPVRKQKQSDISEQLLSLTQLNNAKIVRQRQKSGNSSMQNVINTIKSQFNRLIEIEDKYFEQGGKINSEQIFEEKLQNIVLKAEQKLQSQRKLSKSQQGYLYNSTIYEMYELIKKPAIQLSVEICDDLGKLLHDVTTYQDSLLENMQDFTIKTIQQKDQESQFHNGREIETKVVQFQKQIKRLRKQKDELIAQINQLETENKKYIDSMVRFSRGDKSSIPGLQISSKVPYTNSSISDRYKTSKEPVHHGASNFHSYSGRTLTIKQLKQTIEEIYESKLKFDQKNHDGKLPRETMHQYLFTHLNQKYGLKNLTIEAANSIVSAIQVHSAEDNDVAVFGKILRNQIDEEFRNVQSELKATVHNLLKMHVKSQLPYKSANEINEIYNEKVGHDISMQQCEDIVKYLYNKGDAQKILQMLEIVFKLHKPPEDNHPRRFHSNKREQVQNKKKFIKFALFLQTVLDFQLKNHEKLLKPLVNVFKIRDKDSDGIVDEDEFIAIIEELCEEASEIIPDLLGIVDPYETKSITFTQMVRLVANYPESNPILMRYLQNQQEEG